MINSDFLTYISGNIPGGIILLPLGLGVYTIVLTGVWLGTRFWGISRYIAILILGYVIITGSYAVLWKRSRPSPVPVRVIVHPLFTTDSTDAWKVRGVADLIAKRLSSSPKHFVVQHSGYIPSLKRHDQSESRLDSLVIILKTNWLITVNNDIKNESPEPLVTVKRIDKDKIKTIKELQLSPGSFGKETARLSGDVIRILGDNAPPRGRYGLPQQLPDQAFEELYTGIILLEKDLYDSAASAFIKLQSTYPEWAPPYQELARTRLDKNTFFYKEIIHLSLLSAIEIDPSDPENYILLARLFLHYRDWDEAESAAKLALNLTIDDPRVFFYLSRLRTSKLKGMPQFRKNDLKYRALNLAPGYEMVRLTLAQSYRSWKNRVQAIEVIKDGLQYDPESIPLLMALAANQVEFSKNEEAVITCNKILKQRPGSAEVLYNIGLALSQMGKYDEAIAMLDSSWRSGGTVDNIYYIARAYEKKGDWETAVKYFQERTARLTAPDDPVAVTSRWKSQLLKRWIAHRDSVERSKETLAIEG